MSTNTQAISDTAKRIAEQPWLTSAERDRMAADIAKAIHDAVMAERKRCEVAVAMACHVGKYTPLSEYIAAIRAAPKGDE